MKTVEFYPRNNLGSNLLCPRRPRYWVFTWCLIDSPSLWYFRVCFFVFISLLQTICNGEKRKDDYVRWPQDSNASGNFWLRKLLSSAWASWLKIKKIFILNFLFRAMDQLPALGTKQVFFLPNQSCIKRIKYPQVRYHTGNMVTFQKERKHLS